MSTPNEEPKPATPMEALKQEASACCGSACDCHSSNPSSRCRWLIGVIVLVAAGVLVARAMVKENVAETAPVTPGFASLANTTETSPPVKGNSIAGREINGISELNTLAAAMDAVFVFLPGTNAASALPPMPQLQAAVKTLESQGRKIELFTLKTDSPEYTQLAAQAAVPGVLAMVKGRGMSAVSGEITESKLVQAFVGASSSGGGCGPASAGCKPGAAGCGPRR